MIRWSRAPFLLALFIAAVVSFAQTAPSSPVHPPPVVIPHAPSRNPEPTSPPAQDVTDERTGVVFHLPPGWNVSRTDGELSTFHLDARTAPTRAQMRTVAALNFNPFPLSTFSGAIVYLSVTPKATPASCSAQASAEPAKPAPATVVGGKPFARGYDQHGHICTEARDEIFTAMHAGACVRFDLAINTFCGGEASGARDLTDDQLDELRLRLESVLATVKFTK